MIVLVANLGSTSFKCKLYDMPSERVLGVGAADRLGQGGSNWSIASGAQNREGRQDLADHAQAINLLLDELVKAGAVSNTTALQAIGFKAVHGGPISGAVLVDQKVLDVMEQFADVTPQHNPPYIAAMRAFARMLPNVPQVAAFETAFHQTIPLSRQVYGVPHEWVEKLGIRRYGFHGASHRYIATRITEVSPSPRKIISCHLGGSCSICAIRDGRSVANSFGLTTQSGVFHASRVGDLDAFSLMKLLKSGLDLETVWKKLGKEGGLAGLSGISADMREVAAAAETGNERAKLAIDAFVESCRHYVTAYLGVLNGADALVFTAGIGQNAPQIRSAVCTGLDYAGIRLDEQRNQAVARGTEARIDAQSSRTQIWVLPTDEEIVVARQVLEVLDNGR